MKLQAKCLFEYIYFMDERSNFDGIMIQNEKIGAKLAENDYIISSYIEPDSEIYKDDIVVIGYYLILELLEEKDTLKNLA